MCFWGFCKENGQFLLHFCVLNVKNEREIVENDTSLVNFKTVASRMKPIYYFMSYHDEKCERGVSWVRICSHTETL